MSYMGWIAQMVSDNTYEQFKELYIKAELTNKYEELINKEF